MPIKLNSTGGGSVTLDTPSTANNYTLLIPATNGSLATTTGTTFADITDSGNLTFTGTGNRITGDFSNATLANRVMFQNSVTNGNSVLAVIPNGTATTSRINFYSDSALTNFGFASIGANATSAFVEANSGGTVTGIPLVFNTGGSERMRLDSSGYVLAGLTSRVSGGGRIQSWQVDTNCFECVTNDGQNSTNYGIGWTIANTGQRFARLTGIYTDSTGSGAGSLVMQTKAANGSLRNVVHADASGAVIFPQYGAGTLATNSGGVISASDGRYKTKTRGVSSALETISKLSPTYYVWDEGSPFYNNGEEELGFIAQEVAAVIPEASPGIDALDEDKFKNYSDRAVIAVLTAAIQELKAELDELKAKVK